MSYKILIINPGSTSTKIGVYEDETQLMEETLRHSTEEIATNKLNKVIDKIDHIIKKYDKNAIMAGEGPCMKDLVNIADEDFRNVSICLLYTSDAADD